MRVCASIARKHLFTCLAFPSAVVPPVGVAGLLRGRHDALYLDQLRRFGRRRPAGSAVRTNWWKLAASWLACYGLSWDVGRLRQPHSRRGAQASDANSIPIPGTFCATLVNPSVIASTNTSTLGTCARPASGMRATRRRW